MLNRQRFMEDSGLRPADGKKWTLMWIPQTGLMYDGGKFFDGQMNEVKWDRVIRIFPSHARAETAKKRILERHPDAHGELVILPVSIQEIPEEVESGQE
jgi:hypothetical protein